MKTEYDIYIHMIEDYIKYRIPCEGISGTNHYPVNDREMVIPLVFEYLNAMRSDYKPSIRSYIENQINLLDERIKYFIIEQTDNEAEELTTFLRDYRSFLSRVDVDKIIIPNIVPEDARERELLALKIAKEYPKAKEEKQSNPTEKINEEALKKYFTATFKGAGNNGFNYFDYLTEDIKKVRNSKDAARMALIIYNSDKMIKTQKPNTFKEWYRLFCDMTGCTYNPYYKPSNLDTNKMKDKLSYL